ncbi:hypothetical protein ABW19_dt0208321 [Dactylella cylindrospora]|nr:hypothetical protein ABW19_dt0208321 [Dactylella cylindrospora]
MGPLMTIASSITFADISCARRGSVSETCLANANRPEGFEDDEKGIVEHDLTFPDGSQQRPMPSPIRLLIFAAWENPLILGMEKREGSLLARALEILLGRGTKHLANLEFVSKTFFQFSYLIPFRLNVGG